jgi:hypothetical protein
LADLPESTSTEAARVATNLAELDLRQKAESQTSKIAIRRKTLLRVNSIFSVTSKDPFVGFNINFLGYTSSTASYPARASPGPLDTSSKRTQNISGSDTEGRDEGLERDPLKRVPSLCGSQIMSFSLNEQNVRDLWTIQQASKSIQVSNTHVQIYDKTIKPIKGQETEQQGKMCEQLAIVNARRVRLDRGCPI